MILKSAIFLMMLCCLLILSCSENPEEPEKQSKESTVTEAAQEGAVTKEAGDSSVLALVDGTPISRTDLDQTIRKLVGEEAAVKMDEKARRKVLESMVISRAISLLQEKEMDETQQAVLASEVNAFREQLLVRRYLTAHGAPQPVTMEMIQEYYQTHPEQFGAITIKQYEMITATRLIPAKDRDELVEKMREPEKQTDWRQWVGELNKAGYPLSYRRGRDDGQVLVSKVKQVLSGLSVGQTSSLFFVNEMPVLLRITDEKKIPAKPLAEVTQEIKKALAPRQIKAAIEAAGKEALAKAVVEYK